MSDALLNHYARRSGALAAELIAAEVSLRIALKANRTEVGLRRSAIELLASLERANAEHKTRAVLAEAAPEVEDVVREEPLDPMRGVEFPFAENH